MANPTPNAADDLVTAAPPPAPPASPASPLQPQGKVIQSNEAAAVAQKTDAEAAADKDAMEEFGRDLTNLAIGLKKQGYSLGQMLREYVARNHGVHVDL